MCQIATFYEQRAHLHIPSPKINYFSDEETNEQRTDFGQSNFALSNVRAVQLVFVFCVARSNSKQCAFLQYCYTTKILFR